MKRKEKNAHLLHRRCIRLQSLAKPLPRANMLRALPRRAAQRMRQRLGRNGLMARGLRRRNRKRQVGVLLTDAMQKDQHDIRRDYSKGLTLRLLCAKLVQPVETWWVNSPNDSVIWVG